MEVRFAEDDEHLFRIDQVKTAHYNGKTLILCATARNVYSDDLDTPVTLGIVVPIVALWENADDLADFYRPDWQEHSVYMPHRQLTTQCKLPDNSYRELSVERFPEDRPGNYIDGFSKYELERVITEQGIKLKLLEIPTSFTGKRFSRHKQVVFVHDKPDWRGNSFLEVRLKSIFTSANNAWYDYAWAFIKDTLSFPFQIVMWAEFAGGR